MPTAVQLWEGRGIYYSHAAIELARTLNVIEVIPLVAAYLSRSASAEKTTVRPMPIPQLNATSKTAHARSRPNSDLGRLYAVWDSS